MLMLPTKHSFSLTTLILSLLLLLVLSASPTSSSPVLAALNFTTPLQQQAATGDDQQQLINPFPNQQEGLRGGIGGGYTNRIINGSPVEVGEYPYYVYFRAEWFNGISGRASYCGGSLIAPDIVLTAAHCIGDGNGWTHSTSIGAMRLGINQSGGQVRSCSTVRVHKEYDRSTLANDVALCKLNSPVTIDESRVRLVLNEADNDSYPPNGSKLKLMGLGRTEDADPPNILLDVDVFSISNNECARYYGPAVITDEKICTKVPNSNSGGCQGDSGGPLVVIDPTIPKVHIQVGVVSFGSSNGCGVAPGGFARVSTLMGWIKRTACNELNSVGSICNNDNSDENPPSSSTTGDDNNNIFSSCNGKKESRGCKKQAGCKWNKAAKKCVVDCDDFSNKDECNTKQGCRWYKKRKVAKCRNAPNTSDCEKKSINNSRRCNNKGCIWKRGNKTCVGKWS